MTAIVATGESAVRTFFRPAVGGLAEPSSGADGALPGRSSNSETSTQTATGFRPGGLNGALTDLGTTLGAQESEDSEQAGELTEEEQQVVRELQQRDTEVRRHEAAHAAAGAGIAGAPSYTYEQGPDGRNYAVGGEVSIQVSGSTGDPAATIAKLQQVQRAALAPADPSGQDRQVAAQAAAGIQQARAEEARVNAEEAEARINGDDAEPPADATAGTPAPEAAPPPADAAGPDAAGDGAPAGPASSGGTTVAGQADNPSSAFEPPPRPANAAGPFGDTGGGPFSRSLNPSVLDIAV